MATQWNPYSRGERTARDANVARTRITWGCGGLLLGILIATLALIAFAPHPKTVALSSAGEADITVTLDDKYLTRLVTQGINAANIPAFTVTHVKAHIAPENVLTFSGSVVTGPGLSLVDLTAQAQIAASGGLLVVSNLSGELGGLALPSVVNSALELGINLAITNERQRLTQGGIHYYITGVTSSDGLLTITLSFS